MAGDLVQIEIQGLNEFRKKLRAMDKELPKALRLAFNAAADLVVQGAKPKVPTRSGKAKGSIRARSTQTSAKVMGGGKRVPYYPWLDFGGRVGYGGKIKRKFTKDGRYIYPVYKKASNSGKIQELLVEGLIQVGKEAGLDIS